jgi:hypothetical protein
MEFSFDKIKYWMILDRYDEIKRLAREHYQTQSHYLYVEYEPKLRTKRGWKLHNSTFQQKETVLKDALYKRLAAIETNKQQELATIY